jgi:hypothetical protein
MRKNFSIIVGMKRNRNRFFQCISEPNDINIGCNLSNIDHYMISNYRKFDGNVYIV